MAIFKQKSNVSSLVMEQIKDVEGCLINFENFMRAAVTPETAQETLRSLSVGVHQMENAADRSLRAMIDTLAEGSYLPSTREDIISIATRCDKIANKCEHVAIMTNCERFRFPEDYAKDILEILSVEREQFELLEKSIRLLFEKFGDLLNDHSILDEIREHESHVDKIECKLYERIFGEDLDLAHKMQMVSFVEEICDIADIIEDISDKIQIMLITRKG